MKRALLLVVLFLGIGSTQAKENKLNNNHETVYYGYGNSFIFVESGIEFAVFPDGQFDFQIFRYGSSHTNYNRRNQNRFSFNCGFNYNPYVQYDAFGAIIQIENTLIYYDFYGRVSQIGNVPVFYNNYGHLNRIGRLHVYYRNGIFSHYAGFINHANPYYISRPWHRSFRRPVASFCVLRDYAYRRNYKPERYRYYRPYKQNRRYTFDEGRRNYERNSGRSRNYHKKYNQSNKGRRNGVSNSLENKRRKLADRGSSRFRVNRKSSNSRSLDRRGSVTRNKEKKEYSRKKYNNTVTKRQSPVSKRVKKGNRVVNRQSTVRKSNKKSPNRVGKIAQDRRVRSLKK